MSAPSIVAPDPNPSVYGKQFREGIRSAVALGTGVNDIRWDNEPEGMRSPLGPWIELRAKGLRSTGGIDDTRREDLGNGTYRETQVGDRVVTLRIYCEARSSGEDRAESYLHRFESGWMVSGVRDHLETVAGVAVGNIHPVQPMPDRLSDARDVSVAVLDVELNAASRFVSTVTRDTFDKITLETEVSPAGQPSGDPGNILIPSEEIP